MSLSVQRSNAASFDCKEEEEVEGRKSRRGFYKIISEIQNHISGNQIKAERKEIDAIVTRFSSSTTISESAQEFQSEKKQTTTPEKIVPDVENMKTEKKQDTRKAKVSLTFPVKRTQMKSRCDSRSQQQKVASIPLPSEVPNVRVKSETTFTVRHKSKTFATSNAREGLIKSEEKASLVNLDGSFEQHDHQSTSAVDKSVSDSDGFFSNNTTGYGTPTQPQDTNDHQNARRSADHQLMQTSRNSIHFYDRNSSEQSAYYQSPSETTATVQHYSDDKLPICYPRGPPAAYDTPPSKRSYESQQDSCSRKRSAPTTWTPNCRTQGSWRAQYGSIERLAQEEAQEESDWSEANYSASRKSSMGSLGYSEQQSSSGLPSAQNFERNSPFGSRVRNLVAVGSLAPYRPAHYRDFAQGCSIANQNRNELNTSQESCSSYGMGINLNSSHSSLSYTHQPSQKADDPLEPNLQGYQLIGDSQLLRFSKQLLGKHIRFDGPKRFLGLCVSGQTIKELYNHIVQKFYPVGRKLILLIGTNDLLQKNTLEEMITSVDALVEHLAGVADRILLLTVPPIARYASDYDHWDKLEKYNEHLRRLPVRIDEVVTADISLLFWHPDGSHQCLVDCYEKFYADGNRMDYVHLNLTGLTLIRDFLIKKKYLL